MSPKCNKSTNTDLTMEFIQKQESVLKDQVVAISTVKQRLLSVSMSLSSLDGDDYKTKYFTGFKYFFTLKSIFEFIEPFIKYRPTNALNKEQMFLLTLMKLRLGHHFKDLAFRFGVSEPVASKTFVNCLEVLYSKFRCLVDWKERKELVKTMPASFRKNFGTKVTMIIDCTEIFIEVPSNPTAAAQCFSNYKHHHTIKFLIGISPQRAITYISDGYGGRASDGHITQTCGFLDQLRPGDYVLADKGFRLNDQFSIRGAELLVPAFVVKRQQLHPLEIEKTRKIANVRIHVERLIGAVKQKYEILQHIIPISMLVKRNNLEVSVIDQIMVVCCSFLNMCPSIITN